MTQKSFLLYKFYICNEKEEFVPPFLFFSEWFEYLKIENVILAHPLYCQAFQRQSHMLCLGGDFVFTTQYIVICYKI